jgi:DNA-binding PadR family transcriptional regulator
VHDTPQPLNPRLFLILLALHDGPQHGYGVLKAVEAESNGEIRFDPANLYRSLKLLRRDGLVSTTEDAAASTDRRRVFALTSEGRRVLGAEAARVARLADVVRARKLAPGSGPSR